MKCIPTTGKYRGKTLRILSTQGHTVTCIYPPSGEIVTLSDYQIRVV